MTGQIEPELAESYGFVEGSTDTVELKLKQNIMFHNGEHLDAHGLRVMLRHIMPSAIQPAIVAASLSFGGIILTEAALSFLGLGVNTLVPTWGKMIADSRDYMTVAWHLSFPAVPSWWWCWARTCSATGCAMSWTRACGAARADDPSSTSTVAGSRASPKLAER